MTEIDWDRLQPLRLAAGSHKKGSGKGCAMNVVSYITGEAKITDYPACSAIALSQLVQQLNDRLADPDTGFLSPEHAVAVVDLGMMTVGTAKYISHVALEHKARSPLYYAWKKQHYISDALARAQLNVSCSRSAQLLYGQCHPGERNLFDAEVADMQQIFEHGADKAIEALRAYLTEWRKVAGMDDYTPADTAALEKALIQ